MKTTIIYSLALAGLIAFGVPARADHDKNCKNIHGKVTVITENGLTVNDKLYKVGDTTRITKDDKVVKLENISPGDIVCLDTRGEGDIGGAQVAAVTVLNAKEPGAVREKEYVREKETIRQASHDQACTHLHGKVTRIDDSTIVVEGRPHAYSTATLITKDGQTTKIETLKSGDFICLDEKDGKVASVMVLSPTDAAPFQSREVIREREKIREEK